MNEWNKKYASRHKRDISRRDLIKWGLLAAASAALPPGSLASAAGSHDSRSIFIYNPRTKEYINEVYYYKGIYIPSVMYKIDFLFRDNYNGLMKTISNNLIDILSLLQERAGAEGPFYLVSGYRSPRTNEYLRRRKKGVARKSLHMYGMAADVYLKGASLRSLHRTAVDLHAGGVGYYPRSNFIHIDTGRVRYW